MRRLILIVALLQCAGCIPPMATAPVFSVDGMWRGKIEPVSLNWTKTSRQQTGILLTVEDGPKAMQTTGEMKGGTQLMIGRHVLLVDGRGQPIPWQP